MPLLFYMFTAYIQVSMVAKQGVEPPPLGNGFIGGCEPPDVGMVRMTD